MLKSLLRVFNVEGGATGLKRCISSTEDSGKVGKSLEGFKADFKGFEDFVDVEVDEVKGNLANLL